MNQGWIYPTELNINLVEAALVINCPPQQPCAEHYVHKQLPTEHAPNDAEMDY